MTSSSSSSYHSTTVSHILINGTDDEQSTIMACPTYEEPVEHFSTILRTEYDCVEGWFAHGEIEKKREIPIKILQLLHVLYLQKQINTIAEQLGIEKLVHLVPMIEQTISRATATRAVATTTQWESVDLPTPSSEERKEGGEEYLFVSAALQGLAPGDKHLVIMPADRDDNNILKQYFHRLGILFLEKKSDKCLPSRSKYIYEKAYQIARTGHHHGEIPFAPLETTSEEIVTLWKSEEQICDVEHIHNLNPYWIDPRFIWHQLVLPRYPRECQCISASGCSFVPHRMRIYSYINDLYPREEDAACLLTHIIKNDVVE